MFNQIKWSDYETLVCGIEEVGHGVLTTEYVGDKSREDVIKWFGLDQPDVEWYELRCEEE